jgi:hypothetical protein
MAPQVVLRLAGERFFIPGAPRGEDLAAQLVDLVLHGVAGPRQGGS